MSIPSSPTFLFSSPTSSSRLRKSRFTYRHLHQLSQFSTTCPLRAIAHIDLDAFYAQCESIRLGLPEDQPLAVQQWSGLIAVNYPARASGITRFLDLKEAKKLCPNLICQHVATWMEGEDRWAYRENNESGENMATHKVSLDPYRRFSRQILACIREHTPGKERRVEKASIDEVFIDLSYIVHEELLIKYPNILSDQAPYDDPTELLPKPPFSILDWGADALVDLDDHRSEEEDLDWDDIVMCIASEIVRSIRQAIRAELKFTCSAGIAKNKMLAKLGSAHKKPNNQTIVRNRAVQQFLSDYKFTKIRNLGGKLGDQVVKDFGTDSVRELLKVPLDELKRKLGDDTGSWVWSVIRGDEQAEVTSRTQIKSMLSAKSFTRPINNPEQGIRWLRIFVGDIFSRLVEEGVLENKRRPKTLNLHYRTGGVTRSKQLPIPQGKVMDEESLFDLSKQLLSSIVMDGRVFPCANLSLSVGGFEEGPSGNRGIGGFLVKGEEAKAMNTSRLSDTSEITHNGPLLHPAKRRKVEAAPIARFFDKRSSSHEEEVKEDEEDDPFEIANISHADDGTPTPRVIAEAGPSDTISDQAPVPPTDRPPPARQKPDFNDLYDDEDDHDGLFVHEQEEVQRDGAQTSESTYLCAKCGATVSIVEQGEHEDWHFAKSLQEAEPPHNGGSRQAEAPSRSTATRGAPSRGRGRGATTAVAHRSAQRNEKGQTKLAFG